MLLKDPRLQQYLGLPPGMLAGGGSQRPGGYSVVHSPGSNEGNPDWQLGSRLPGIVNRSKVLQPLGMYLNLLRTNPLAATLGTAMAGGAAGYGLGKIQNKNPMATGLVGALAGGGAAGIAGTVMNRNWQAAGGQKQASALQTSAGDLTLITQRLSQDTSLDSNTQSKLFGLLNELSPSQVRILSNLVKGVMGGSVGAIIARYLMGLGLAGTAIGAAVGGGLMGGDMFHHHNSMGQSQSGQSPFGGGSFEF